MACIPTISPELMACNIGWLCDDCHCGWVNYWILSSAPRQERTCQDCGKELSLSWPRVGDDGWTAIHAGWHRIA